MSKTAGKVAAFNPGNISPENLEKLLVGREMEAEKLSKRIIDSARDRTGCSQQLVIAPRGLGKTHLLNIVFSRLNKSAEIKNSLVIAFFREEEHVHSYLDFLRRVLEAVNKGSIDKNLSEALAEIYRSPYEKTESQTELVLANYIGDRMLLVILENIGDIFEGLGTSGQQKLRAFIQQTNKISILASAQRLFEPLEARNFPFYGFFDRNYLDALKEGETLRLLINISELTNDLELAQFLQTPRGQARASAIHQLTNGNPRLVTLLSQFLTKERLDELTGAFHDFIETSLTPYFQEQMNRLSPLQRRIVEILCDKGDGKPLAVKEIAVRSLTSPQSISAQLRKMGELGVLNAQKRGRETLYEMKEPLWRVSIEVKNSTDGVFPFIVSVIKEFKTPNELFVELLNFSSSIGIAKKYYSSALHKHMAEFAASTPGMFMEEHIMQLFAIMQMKEIDALEVAKRYLEELVKQFPGTIQFKVILTLVKVGLGEESKKAYLDYLNGNYSHGVEYIAICGILMDEIYTKDKDAEKVFDANNWIQSILAAQIVYDSGNQVKHLSEMHLYFLHILLKEKSLKFIRTIDHDQFQVLSSTLHRIFEFYPSIKITHLEESLSTNHEFWIQYLSSTQNLPFLRYAGSSNFLGSLLELIKVHTDKKYKGEFLVRLVLGIASNEKDYLQLFIKHKKLFLVLAGQVEPYSTLLLQAERYASGDEEAIMEWPIELRKIVVEMEKSQKVSG